MAEDKGACFMSRKPSYLQAGDAATGRWIVSYSDIVTILLVLFVALAAQTYKVALASPPVAKAAVNTLVSRKDAAIHNPDATAMEAPKPPAPNLQKTLLDAERALRERGIKPDLENRGLVINLPQSILFPSGGDQIGPNALPVLTQIVEVVGAIPNKITLVGHSDSLPIHSTRFKNNWELATARSVNLLELLATRYGIAESRLSVASPGAYRPKGSNDTETGRAENRRVEIVILPESDAEPAGTAK
jgi:chemotaxis protein MotB